MIKQFNSHSNDALVDVRFVATYYHTYGVWEEDPGSMRNVVSDVTGKEITLLGEMTIAVAELLTRPEIEAEFYIDFDDDEEEEADANYTLEYRDPATHQWRFLKTVSFAGK